MDDVRPRTSAARSGQCAFEDGIDVEAARQRAEREAALVLTARGLRRGQQLAWGATMVLLVVTAVLHVVKGLDLEEALLTAGMAIWLLRHRDAFPVLPTRAAVRTTVIVGVGGGVGALLIGTVLTYTFDRRHHPKVGESLRAVADRLGGATTLPLPGTGRFVTPMLIATGIGLIWTVLWVLLSPRAGRHLTGAAHLAERERARALLAVTPGRTLDYFALRDDKDWFFSEHSMVAHSVRRGVCLVSPDPIGPEAEREEVWADFMGYVERNGWSVAVVGAAEDWLPVYESTGLRSLYLGDEAVVDCRAFNLEGRARKSLRGAYGRVQRAGFTVSDIDGLTGLAEYRNGGLFVDASVLNLHDPLQILQAHDVASELVVEWRSLTVALLDRLADVIRGRLGMNAETLPLARILEGGTWAAGRAIALEKREGGTPPITVVSDGTVF